MAESGGREPSAESPPGEIARTGVPYPQARRCSARLFHSGTRRGPCEGGDRERRPHEVAARVGQGARPGVAGRRGDVSPERPSRRLARRARVSLARTQRSREGGAGVRRAGAVAHRHPIHQHRHGRQCPLEPPPGAGRRSRAGGRRRRRPPRHLPDQQPRLERPVPQPGRLSLRRHYRPGRRRDDRPPLDGRRLRRRRRGRRPRSARQHARRRGRAVPQRRTRQLHRADAGRRARLARRQHDDDADRRGWRRAPRSVRRQLQDPLRHGRVSTTGAGVRFCDPRGPPAPLRGRSQVPQGLPGGGSTGVQPRVDAAACGSGWFLPERRYGALHARPVDLGPLPGRGRKAAGCRSGVLRLVRQVHRRRWGRRAGSVRVRRLRGSRHVLAERRHGDLPRRAAPRGPQHQQLLDGRRLFRCGSRRQRRHPGRRHAGPWPAPQEPGPHSYPVAQADRPDRRPTPMAAQHAALEPGRRHVRADRRLRRDRGLRLDVGRAVPRRGLGWVRGCSSHHRPSVGRDGRGHVGARANDVYAARLAARAGAVSQARHQERRLSQ